MQLFSLFFFFPPLLLSFFFLLFKDSLSSFLCNCFYWFPTEFCPLALGIFEVLRIRNLLKEIQLEPKGLATIHRHNKSAIILPTIRFNITKKHLFKCTHFIKEKIESEQIPTPFVPTSQQLVDKLGMHNIYYLAPAWGGAIETWVNKSMLPDIFVNQFYFFVTLIFTLFFFFFLEKISLP